MNKQKINKHYMSKGCFHNLKKSHSEWSAMQHSAHWKFQYTVLSSYQQTRKLHTYYVC